MSGLKITNYNYAGVPIFLGLVVGPPAVGWFAWLWLSGRMAEDLHDVSDWIGAVGGTVLLVGLCVFAFVYALGWAVLWAQLGQRVVVRYLLATRTYDWDELAELEFEHEEERLPLIRNPVPGAGPIASVKVGGSRFLVLARRDGKRLGRLLLDRRQDYKLTRFLRQCRAAENVAYLGGTVSWKGPTVAEVSFQGTRLDDGQLAELQLSLESFPNLTALDLSGTKVTDSALESLVGIEKLEELKTQGTGVTAEGLARLERAHAEERNRQSFFPAGRE